MLWTVEGTGLNIIGTVHVADGPIELSEVIERAVRGAQTVAYETNFNLKPDQRPRFQPKGAKLSDSVRPELVAAASAALSAVGFSDDIERYRPWALGLELSVRMAQADGFTYPGVDQAVRDLAKGKAAHYFETPDAQIGSFASGPLSEQVAGLEYVLNNVDEARQVVGKMVRAWRAKDLPASEQLLRDYEAITPVTAGNVVRARNAAWLPHFKRLALGRKRVTAVLGVLHMVGPTGLPEMLGGAGFKCARVE